MIQYLRNNPRQNAGLSLVELMVAIALGVVITFAAVNLFLQSKISYLQDEETARLQENGRYALRYLSRELSMAGYLGGVLKGSFITSNPSGSECFEYLAEFDPNTPFPFELHSDVTSTTDPDMPTQCWSGGDTFVNFNENTPDVLVIRRTKDSLAGFTDPSNTATPALDDAKFYLRVEDSNVSVSLVKGTGAGGVPVEWSEYYPQIIFVRDYSITAGDNVPSLCRKRITSNPSNDKSDTECLVEGIENMQIEIGVDEDGDQQADLFVTQPSEAQMLSAVAARIYLLVRSVNPVSGYTNDKSYQLGEKTIPVASDGYYRRVMQSTVLLRNSEAFKF